MSNLMTLAHLKLLSFQNKVAAKLSEERGDTNFLSIIIILVIVLAVATVFILFKDEIMATAEAAFASFQSMFSGQGGSVGGP